ncbi:MAG: nucleotide exchange factor GrpE [Gammaproteobacteria bacterium 28-57-27]|nr:MAG: nucleotide exchange factor GrpE [Gammaproteobacteria bacterium 28-57-27]
MSQDQNTKPETTETVQAVEIPPETAPEASGNEEPSVHMLLEDARSKADEHWNEVLRLRADMDNLRKRTERDIDNARKYALERFMDSLLGVADSLDLGLKACMEASEVEPLKKGTEIMYNQFFQTLERYGVKAIDPKGEPFNPDLHQAISMLPGEVEPNTVLQVLQKGYQLNERILRPALVIVSQ